MKIEDITIDFSELSDEELMRLLYNIKASRNKIVHTQKQPKRTKETKSTEKRLANILKELSPEELKILERRLKNED